MIAYLAILLSTLIVGILLDRHRKRHQFLAESTVFWLCIAAGVLSVFIMSMLGFELSLPSGRKVDQNEVAGKSIFGFIFLLLIAAIQQSIAMYRRRRERLRNQK